jgi:hypothetical protein
VVVVVVVMMMMMMMMMIVCPKCLTCWFGVSRDSAPAAKRKGLNWLPLL